MGYLAWENIVNDKPVVRTIADVLVGEEAVDKGVEMAGQAAEKVEQTVDQAGEALQGVKESVSTLNQTWGGIGSFLGNLASGNGLDMFGNFFSNLGISFPPFSITVGFRHTSFVWNPFIRP